MKQQNTNTHHRSGDSLRSSEDLIVSVDDYVRLRELVADHALAEELELAIVVPSDRIPKDVVTMNSRLIYADESTGQTREVELVYPSEADPVAGTDFRAGTGWLRPFGAERRSVDRLDLAKWAGSSPTCGTHPFSAWQPIRIDSVRRMRWQMLSPEKLNP